MQQETRRKIEMGNMLIVKKKNLKKSVCYNEEIM